MNKPFKCAKLSKKVKIALITFKRNVYLLKRQTPKIAFHKFFIEIGKSIMLLRLLELKYHKQTYVFYSLCI